MVSGMVVENMTVIEMIRELNAIRKGLAIIAEDASEKNGFTYDRPVELEILGERLIDLSWSIQYYNSKTKSASEYGTTLEEMM